MKDIINLPGPTVKIIESPVPEPKANQVLIKVIVAGSNPKDWKSPEWAQNYEGPFAEMMKKIKHGINQGDDLAGVIEKVGPGVLDFKPGDRVAAFHEIGTPAGSYAEYGIAWSNTTFHIPDHTSFEEAATIPLAGLTAAIALYRHLKLPPPWLPAVDPIPFIVYGASTAVGAFALKLAVLGNVHPIIAFAGKGKDYVSTLLDSTKGDMVLDYRDAPDNNVKKIRDYLDTKNLNVKHALEAGVGEKCLDVFKELVLPDSAVNLVLPDDFDVPFAVKSSTAVGEAHNGLHMGDGRDLAYIVTRYFTRALQARSFVGHPFEVRPGGLKGVEQALKDLKNGKASAVKYVVRIADTPGL